MREAASPVNLLVSDTVWDAHGEHITAVCPRVRPVLFVGDEPLPPEALADVDVAFFSGDVWPARARGMMVSILKSPRLAWLHTFSSGVDDPVFAAFAERGVIVTNSAGSSASPIAQTVMMYMLMLSRDMGTLSRQQRDKVWQQHRYDELDGATCTVIGYGPIGAEVVRLAAAFGMEVTVCRRTPTGAEPCAALPLARLREAVGRSRWVVLALPLNDDTRGIFGADVMEAMAPGSYLVNVGRGELVDESELAVRLADGRIAGAGLDVFAVEPLPADSPLWEMPNVIITPHNSGTTTSTTARATEIFLDNLMRWCAGEPLRNVVLAES
jgi:phosphoglycerate dehydrogenase-like enzyme